MVLKEDHTARCWWKLGQIIKVLKGRDDQVCGACIQVLNNERKPTVLHRPVQHLIPLEVTHENNSNI